MCLSLRINSTAHSLKGQRILKNRINESSSSLKKLSSGERIISASDDAASLAISEKMKAYITGSKMAERNANDGVSLLQVAEGGLSTVNELLIRMREISVQAANDTYSRGDRAFLNREYQQLKNEIDRVAEGLEFNGRKLLDGTGDRMEIQIGVKNNQLNDRLYYDSKKINATLGNLLDLKVDRKYQDNSSVEREIAIINADPSYSSEKERAAKKVEAYKRHTESKAAASRSVHGDLNVLTKESSRGSLRSLDQAIRKVSSQRAEIGSLQNRLGSVISNLQESGQNISSANSRLRESDYASETANSTKQNILTKGSTAALAQMNKLGSNALKLI